MSKISDQDSLRRDSRFGLRSAQVRADLNGVRAYDATSRPGTDWSFPSGCDAEGGRCSLQPVFGDPEGSVAVAKGAELDCRVPLCLQCFVCGEVRWLRCRSTHESTCLPCARRWLTSKRYQLRDALEAFAFHGYHVGWLTLTFPGFGGCKPWCLCHEVRRREGMSLGEWNGSLTKRWHDAKQWLERELGFPIEHHRSVEPQMGQRRKIKGGSTRALHLHLWLVSPRPIKLSDNKWREFCAKFGFGHSFSFESWSCGVGSVPFEFLERVGYSTGYLKARVTDELRSVPYVHPDPERRTGEDVCKVRAFSNSRGFCDSVDVMKRRWVLLQKHRESLVARCKVLDEQRIAAVAADVGGEAAGGSCDGEAGAFKALLDELHRTRIPVLPTHHLGLPM